MIVESGPARILEVERLPDLAIENRCPGKVLFLRDGRPVVVCGSGLLKVTWLEDDSGASLLPLGRLRVRFSSRGPHET